MAEVPAVSTPIAPPEQGRLLVDAWAAKLGVPPTRSLAELCLAQLLLENASGVSLYNNNLGNLTGGEPYYLNPKVRALLHFASYDTPEAGAAAYVSLINRAGKLRLAGESGNALEFAQAIRDSNYTPGIDVDKVAASLSGVVGTIRAKSYLPDLAGHPAGLPERYPLRRFALAGSLAGVAFIAWWCFRAR